jgi:multidrug efflux system membrane fusion protein
MFGFSSGSVGIHRRIGYKTKSCIALAVSGLVSIVLLALWPAPGNAEKKPGTAPGPGGAPIAVAVTQATTDDLPVYLDAPGTVTPVNTVLVRSRVSGQLQQVHFEEGQLVNAGDLLAQIDARPFEVQLAQAQSQLLRDEALLRNARLDLERYTTLWSQDSISLQELDTQKALVEQYQSAVAASQAQVESAKLQLAYSRITSPISGRTGLRQIDPGNIISSSDSEGLVVITQLQPINVIFTVPEDELAAVAEQMQAGISLKVEAWNRDRSRKLAEGKLVTFDNQIDPSTGTVKLKAVFDNEATAHAPMLFPNQFVNVRLLVDTLRNATLVPVAAVQHGVNGNFVYEVQPDQTVRRQPVSLGAVNGELVAIVDGLDAGAQIVLDGSDRLRDGVRVQPVGDGRREQSADGKAVIDAATKALPTIRSSAASSPDAINKSQST